MSNNSLDQTRGLFEESEIMERMIVQALKTDVQTHRHKLDQSLYVRKMLDRMQTIAQKLERIYKDADPSRRYDTDFLGGKKSIEDVYTSFYSRFEEITSFHRRFVDSKEDLTTDEAYFGRLSLELQRPSFSGEEGYGRYLDLHVLHNKYLNAKFGSMCSYIEYLNEKAWAVHTITEQHRLSSEYRSYLTELLEYVEDFYHRSQPLGSLDKIYKKIFSDFDTQWQKGKVPGWESCITLHQSRNEKSTNDTTQNSRRSHAEFITQPEQQISKKASLLSNVSERCIIFQQTALNELKLQRLSWELRHVIEDTVGRVENKFTKTFEQMSDENEDEALEIAADEENQGNETIYNPLRLPLGPDGKPIPFWLYKLHGLNRRFACEICGNYYYEGRRSFEKHFNEPRHRLGMQAIGVPHSKIFFEITKIDDAVRLWDTFKTTQLQSENCGTDSIKEYEDAEGNVYDAKTFELLKKQGVI